jgi:tetratricopeptide (TPR) repeat protein
MRRRVEVGRLEEALADAEHLEATAHGTAEKLAVWQQAGREWQTAGMVEQAGALFERALVYAPDDVAALAGLGEALARSGHPAHGTQVLRRALSLAEAKGVPSGPVRLSLARALGEQLGDLPAAIAHASAVSSTEPEAPLARGLEGRWRARLGDVAGASLAFARLRELSRAVEGSDARGEALGELLREGGQVLRDLVRDLPAARRCLAAALRLLPHDAALRAAYREVCALTAGREREAPQPLERPRRVLEALSQDADAESDGAAAARVEELSRRLQAAPTDDGVVRELAGELERLRRAHELVALFLAQLEDSPPERRARIAELAKVTLERCATSAEEEGRRDDATLLRSALAMVG